MSLERLGNIKFNGGDKAGALTAYEEMLAIDRRSHKADSGNALREREVMISLNKVGDARFDLQRHERGPCRLRGRAHRRPSPCPGR